MKITQIIWLALALSFMSAANAAVTTSPVHLTIEPGVKTVSLQLSSDSDRDATVEIRGWKWLGQNADGTDILEPTTALVFSRPVLTLPAHGQVTIRIILKSRSSAAEDTYRVLVNDITPQPPAGAAVEFRMNSVLPMFVLNDKKSHGTLELSDGGVLTNVGNRHVRISELTDTDGKQIKLLRYVMPSQSITLPVKSAKDVVTNDDVY